MEKKRVLPFEASSSFFHRRAERYMDKQDYLSAVRNLRRAMELDPQNAQVALDLADTYARMGLYETSNVELELLLDREEPVEEVPFAIGCNLMAMGDYAQAHAFFSNYLDQFPEGQYVGLALDGIAQIEESEEEDGIERELELMAEQGKAALDCGDAQRAAEIFEQVLHDDPTLLYVRNNLALAYMCLEDNMSAWKQLSYILEEEPGNVHACCNAALILNSQGLRDKAVSYMSRMLPEQMEEMDELYKYCLTAAELKLDEMLLQGLKPLLLRCPYETSMLYLYGVCLLNKGRYQEAERMLERLLVIEPSHLPARDMLKLCRRAMNGQTIDVIDYSFEYTDEQMDELQAQLEKLISLYPDVEAMQKQIAENRSLMEAALLGEDGIVCSAMLALSSAGGPVAEDLLRRLLLSMTHGTHIKRMAVQSLTAMKAREPYIAYIDGQITHMRGSILQFEHVPPKAYLAFIDEMLLTMGEIYGEDNAVAYSLYLWTSYLNSLDGHFPPLRDKPAWLAATRARYEQDVLGKTVDLEALAREEGCTPRTLLTRMRRLSSAGQGGEN